MLENKNENFNNFSWGVVYVFWKTVYRAISLLVALDISNRRKSLLFRSNFRAHLFLPPRWTSLTRTEGVNTFIHIYQIRAIPQRSRTPCSADRAASRHATRCCRNWPYRASGVYAITARTIVAGCGELPSKHRYQVSRARFEEALGFWLSVSVVVGVRQPLFLIRLRCPIGFQFATRKRKRDGSIARQVHSRGKRNCQFHPILYTVRNNKTYMNLSTQVIHICISLF